MPIRPKWSARRAAGGWSAQWDHCAVVWPTLKNAYDTSTPKTVLLGCVSSKGRCSAHGMRPVKEEAQRGQGERANAAPMQPVKRGTARKPKGMMSPTAVEMADRCAVCPASLATCSFTRSTVPSRHEEETSASRGTRINTDRNAFYKNEVTPAPRVPSPRATPHPPT